MKIILKKDHEKLGNIGDIVNVKDGYATNFLIPGGIAMKATDSNLRVLEEIKKQREKKMRKEISDAETLASELEKQQVTITVKVDEEEKIYGSVSPQMIAENLAEQGFNIDKKQIHLEEHHIKQLGIYNVEVKLNHNVKAQLKVWVVKES